MIKNTKTRYRHWYRDNDKRDVKASILEELVRFSHKDQEQCRVQRWELPAWRLTFNIGVWKEVEQTGKTRGKTSQN
jgi:hypothetical protein